MYSRQTSPDTGSATSSRESADGPLQPDLLGGPMIASCGPVPRRASRSPSQAKGKPRLTIGTSGPTFFGSPVPGGPLSSWENRLRRRLARTGSTECSMTWKVSATPAGRSLSRLVPSMPRTDVIDFGLWHTSMASDGTKWDATVPAILRRIESGKNLGLAMQSRMACWPTPTATLANKAVRTMEGAIKEAERSHSPDLSAVVQAAVALYPTPRASANENRTTRIPPSQMDGRHGLYLSSVAIGMEPGGSSATTEKSGALNPQFVCWLMGFPVAWDSCAPTAMPSSRRSRQK